MFTSFNGFSQCATNAYISSGENCISLSWFPSANIPTQLPVTVTYNGELYTFSNGFGDIGFPAVYKKVAGDCLLPSELLNGNLTFNFSASASFTCQFPSGVLLALRDVALKVAVNGQKCKLGWSTSYTAVESFEVERSTDGRSFQKIGSVKPSVTSEGSQSFNFSDDSYTASTLYYRLKIVEKNKVTWYTKIVKVQNGVQATAISIFPNPNKGTFELSGVTSADVQSISIYNALGTKLAYKIRSVNTSNQSVQIALLNVHHGMICIGYGAGSNKVFTKAIVE